MHFPLQMWIHHFGLYTYPCQAIPLQVGTVQLPSGTLISIEKSTTIEFDPIVLYRELLLPEVRLLKELKGNHAIGGGGGGGGYGRREVSKRE